MMEVLVFIIERRRVSQRHRVGRGVCARGGAAAPRTLTDTFTTADTVDRLEIEIRCTSHIVVSGYVKK